MKGLGTFRAIEAGILHNMHKPALRLQEIAHTVWKLKSTFFLTKHCGLLAILNQGAWKSMSPCELSHVMSPSWTIQIKILISVNHSYERLAYERLATYPVLYCRKSFHHCWECGDIYSLARVGVGEGGLFDQFLIGMCRWPLRIPTPL